MARNNANGTHAYLRTPGAGHIFACVTKKRTSRVCGISDDDDKIMLSTDKG